MIIRIAAQAYGRLFLLYKVHSLSRKGPGGSMKKRTLRTIPRYLTLISVILLTAFGFLSYYLIDVLSQKRSLEYFEGMSVKAEQSVSAYLNEIKKIANLVSYSRIVQEYLFESTPYLRVNAQRAATDLITNIMSSYPDICEVAFYKRDGSLFQMSGEYTTLIRTAAQGHQMRPGEKGQEPFFSGVVYNTSNRADADTAYFLFVYPVYSLIEGEFSPNPNAACLVLAKLKDLAERHMDGMDISEATIALMEEDRLVFSNRTLTPQEESEVSAVQYGGSIFSMNGEKSLVFRHRLEGTRWNASLIAPESALSKDLILIRLAVLLFILTGIIVQSALLGLGTRQLSAPLNKLLDGIRKIDLKQKIQTRLTAVQVEEIDLLSESINDMLDKIEQVEQEQEETRKKLYGASLLKKQAQLQYYRSQINPHFLYNTLECISAMARISGIACIESICTSMADMFRYSAGDSATVTLRQEIAHAENYFNVISQRTANRYFLKISVSAEGYETKIQKMILQPLLENSVKHGFEGKEAPCRILIRASVEASGKICILVADNGFGIAPVRLKRLNAQLRQNNEEPVFQADTDASIGIFNINQRMKLAYNGQSSMEIFSKYGCYTCVKIWLPPEEE